MEEVFKNIPGYDGYQVSDKGSVKSLKTKNGAVLLKCGLDPKGYPRVCIKSNNKRKVVRVHKLVQLAFNLGEGMIDHVSGVKSDNSIENLRVVTSRENSQNKIYHRCGKLVGSSYIKARAHLEKPWLSSIGIGGKSKYIGFFETEQEANEAYMNKLAVLGEL